MPSSSKQAERSTLRRVGFSVIVAITGCVVPLALAEFAARWLAPELKSDAVYSEALYWRVLNSLTDLEGAMRHPRYGYSRQPQQQRRITTAEFDYVITTNEHGFRSIEFTIENNTSPKIVLLGDSMFEGVGTTEDQRLASLLRRLSVESSHPHEVFNLAVAGFNTVQALASLQVHGRTLQPQHVILGFFVGNDVVANYVSRIDENGHYAVSDPHVADIMNRAREAHPGPLWRSRLYRLLNVRALAVRLRYQLALGGDVLARSCQLIDAVASESRTLHASFSVVILYPKHVAEHRLLAAWSGAESVGRAIADCSRGAGVTVIDSIAIIRGSDEEQRYYWRHDGHLNAHGERLLATALWQSIADPRTRVNE